MFPCACVVQANNHEPMPKPKKRKPSNLLNQTQAAAIIGVSRPVIPAMVARGELDGDMHGGFLLVTKESVERARDQRAALKAAG